MIFKRSRLHQQKGFTLFEVMVTLPLAMLLIIGAMNLFLTASRTEIKTYAEMNSAEDAANAVQEVVDHVREAQWFTLAGEGAVTPEPAFTPAPGESDSDYETTLPNGETDYTAIELTMPPTLTPTEVGYTNLTFNSITVMNSSGGNLPASSSESLPSPPFFRDGSPSLQPMVLIYRSDDNGVPDPTTGNCLWETIFQNVSILSSRALCRSIATGAPNAVQFVRPFENGEALPYQMEIKIISGAYSPINNTQTSEEEDGTYTSELVGKCVLMRNHATTAGSSSALTGAHPTNNMFQRN